MSDLDRVDALVSFASDAHNLQNAQRMAAQKLLDYDGEVYPHDGCAITLSTLMQSVGIVIPDVYQAIRLGAELRQKRNWSVVPLGAQRTGDVGSTCGSEARHGSDHIYLVLKATNADEMVIADNQKPYPHFRLVSGSDGRTPTRFFLRASDKIDI